MAKTQVDVYKEVTDRMIAQLEEGVSPWRKPWASLMPRSMSTGKAYRGMNIFLLSAREGEGGNWWGTYKQIAERGGRVRKGEKSSLVVYWKFGKSEKDGVEKGYAFCRHFSVFNATQAEWPDGMPEKFKATTNDHNPIVEAQAIWEGYKSRPSLIHGGDRACYSPSEDRVRMPELNAFESPEAYYSTLFHEATHSTGHADRLNRESVTNPISFGSHTYGMEELIAEMGSAFLMAHCGIESQFEASAAYLGSWIKTIRESPKMVIQAAGKAQRAADLILNISFDKTDEKE